MIALFVSDERNLLSEVSFSKTNGVALLCSCYHVS